MLLFRSHAVVASKCYIVVASKCYCCFEVMLLLLRSAIVASKSCCCCFEVLLLLRSHVVVASKCCCCFEVMLLLLRSAIVASKSCCCFFEVLLLLRSHVVVASKYYCCFEVLLLLRSTVVASKYCCCFELSAVTNARIMKNACAAEMADFPRAKEALLNRLEAILADVNNFFDAAAFPDFIESIRTRFQSLFRTAMNINATVTLPESVFEQIAQSIALLDSQPEIEDGSSTSYHCEVKSTGERGRSRFVITRDQLEYLLANDFSISKIALLLGVSPSTIRRRMAQFGISVADTYTVVSDEQLTEEIRDVKTNHPNSGYRAAWSQLRSKGIKVPVHRVRLLCLRIDPVGVATR